VSRYNATTNYVGTGGFPPAGSTMTLISNQFATDTFIFNPATDSFKYLVSGTLYQNNTTDINTLLGLAATATPNQGAGTNNFADFTVPALNAYLYLIWDFRAAIPTNLCYSDLNITDACCGCGPLSPESYNCVSGMCVDPGDGSGVYSSLGDCESSCSSIVSYNCVSGTCIDPGDGSGIYSTLASCQNNCVPVQYTIDNSASDNALDACNGSVSTSLVWTSPGNTGPVIGMIFYDYINLTTPFIGSTGWRKLTLNGVNYAAEVNSVGELTNFSLC
jgi:hypothetical protein